MTSCKPVSFSRRTLHHEVSKYINILFTNVAAGRIIQAGGPRVGDPWSKTKRLAIAMICKLHFDIIRAIKKHIFNGTHEPLLICALICVLVSLRAKKHTHYKQTEALLVTIKRVDLSANAEILSREQNIGQRHS